MTKMPSATQPKMHDENRKSERAADFRPFLHSSAAPLATIHPTKAAGAGIAMASRILTSIGVMSA